MFKANIKQFTKVGFYLIFANKTPCSINKTRWLKAGKRKRLIRKRTRTYVCMIKLYVDRRDEENNSTQKLLSIVRNNIKFMRSTLNCWNNCFICWSSASQAIFTFYFFSFLKKSTIKYSCCRSLLNPRQSSDYILFTNYSIYTFEFTQLLNSFWGIMFDLLPLMESTSYYYFHSLTYQHVSMDLNINPEYRSETRLNNLNWKVKLSRRKKNSKLKFSTAWI